MIGVAEHKSNNMNKKELSSTFNSTHNRSAESIPENPFLKGHVA